MSAAEDALVELIEWHFAALVSGNNMPHMSGEPRARLHPGQRRRLNDAARAALAALRAARPDVAAVLDGEAVAVPEGEAAYLLLCIRTVEGHAENTLATLRALGDRLGKLIPPGDAP